MMRLSCLLFTVLLHLLGTVGAQRNPVSAPTEGECLNNSGECPNSSVSDMNKAIPTQNTLTDGIVHELGIENFASVIGSSSFALVLFYDPDTPHTHARLKLQREVLHQLAQEYASMKQPHAFFARNLNVSFALLDTRKHCYLRYIYSRKGTYRGLGEEYFHFYRDYDQLKETWSPIPSTMVNSSTFMRLKKDELPTFPSSFMLFFGSDYNIVDIFDHKKEVNGVPIDDYYSVREWLGAGIRKHLHFAMEGVDKPRLPFYESDDGPIARISSQIEDEKRLKSRYYESDPMESINWEEADRMAADRKAASKSEGVGSDLFRIEVDDSGKTFYRFKLADKVSGQYDAEIMKDISRLQSRYLTWADSYENLWDDDRKAREDERTNYGFYLQKMNEQVKDMLFSVFEELERNKDSQLVRNEHVPNLKRFYEDMLFGYGRSPSSLNKYMQEVVLQKTDDDSEGIEWFQRIREYMHVREIVGERGKREHYGMYFRTLWIKWYAILAEFQENLSRHYIAYLEDHPDETLKRYRVKNLDVIDMGDPKNFDLLSNYEEFERRYVEKGKPYILSNVRMTEPRNYTLDYLVDVCGFIDVTDKVRQSVAIGDESVKRWGGLKIFELPDELLTKGKVGSDKEISLQQFVALKERFEDLYLHDFGLKTECDTLFWSKTPYDPPEEQYFRIPSVIGRYDLSQKLPKSRFQNVWPSLFIGRKGSNSKLHIDNGATGFWLYLVSGKKRWVIYDRAEIPLLYQNIGKNGFMADVLALNSTADDGNRARIHDFYSATYPLLSRASSEGTAYEIVQEANQLVYIPPNTPHAVENLEDIIGISFNQIPRAGLAAHLLDLIHEHRDFGSLEITLRYLKSPNAFSLADSGDPHYITLGEYVAQ